jgi:hypothetical protein
MAEHGLASPWLEKRTCSQCQQENEPGRDFCWACHGKLSEEGKGVEVESGSPEPEGVPYAGGLRLEKGSSSASEQPRDVPAPEGLQPDQGTFPVYSPPEVSPRKEGNKFFPQVTDLESAADAAKQGVWAAGVIAAVTTTIALIALVTGTSIIGLDGLALLDGSAFALIAWGIHRKSRVASVSGLLLYLFELIAAMADGQGMSGGVTIIFFVIAFGNSIRGTFAYHRLHAQLKSVIDPETGFPDSSIPELSSLPMAVKLFGGVFVAGFVALALLGLLLPATTPETAVLEGDQLSTELHAIVESLDILGPAETILYFYSDGIWDIEEGFYLLTNQALILWGENFVPEGTAIPVRRLAPSEITSIGVYYSDSWMDDSVVRVDSAGWNYQFPLSVENGGDRRFITALEEAAGVASTVLKLTDFD